MAHLIPLASFRFIDSNFLITPGSPRLTSCGPFDCPLGRLIEGFITYLFTKGVNHVVQVYKDLTLDAEVCVSGTNVLSLLVFSGK